jgi:exodeoxyribonuclease VII large subunit
MNSMAYNVETGSGRGDGSGLAPARRVWPVAALCRALADTLEARFNPVRVAGEIASFSRATSGHCYFSLKDANAQLRCAMFKRAAGMLDFQPREGESVEVTGRLDIYGPRGDLQLIVESMTRQGQGNLYEQFIRLKAQLEAEGLFDASRKRALPVTPRQIGVVTSLGAAALHDVITALRRRVPHVSVVISPAAVQGGAAADELVHALQSLYEFTDDQGHGVDTILLVRGGGSMEDLWSFNDERLARTIAQSPVPVISGVGHETDFTIADFVADLRAPTPTAAAELVCQSTQVFENLLDQMQDRLQAALERHADRQAQRLDAVVARLGRPSAMLTQKQTAVASIRQQLLHAVRSDLQWKQAQWGHRQQSLKPSAQRAMAHARESMERAGLRLGLLDPSLVLRRGYAWLTDAQGASVASVDRLSPGDGLRATLVDGAVDVQVRQVQAN